MSIGMDHIAEDDMPHFFRQNPRSLDRLADNGGAQFSGRLILQASAIISNGSAYTAQDDDFCLCHKFFFSFCTTYKKQ